MLAFSILLRISRPRFRHYILGPMLILFVSIWSFQDILDSFVYWGSNWIFDLLMIIVILWYFTVPANLWIYGWNDIADGDTDKFNNKKGNYEIKIEDSSMIKKKLRNSIWIWNIGYIVFWNIIFWYIIWLNQWYHNSLYNILLRFWFFIAISTGILFLFLLLSYLYSCKPLRAKARPFIDGIINILYIIIPFILWAVELYIQHLAYEPWVSTAIYVSRTTYSCLFLASLFRCMAMHCYSAIPDIEPDLQAGLNTTAVYLGKKKSLIYCTVLYLLSALFSFPVLGWFSIMAGTIYISIMLISYTRKDIFSLYTLFPYINLGIWFWLFRYIILYI